MFESKRACWIFLWRQIRDGDGVEDLFARQLRVRQDRKPIHPGMGSIVPDDADFREHTAEFGISHVERDNRLPNGWNIIAKLISGILRLVSGQEHEIRAPIRNTHLLSTMPTPPWAYAAEVSRTVERSHAANPRVIIIFQTLPKIFPPNSGEVTLEGHSVWALLPGHNFQFVGAG
jgi:hypothetical protein